MGPRRAIRLSARTGDRESVASRLLAEAASPAASRASRALVVDDHGGETETALIGADTETYCWRRWALRLEEPARRARVHAPEPPGGPFDLVAMRLPRDWASFEMQLHLAAARLAPDGRVLVVGANDEGIKSAPRRIDALFERAEVTVNKRRMRVLEARQPRNNAGTRGSVEDWRAAVEAGGRTMVSYPGVFAEGRLDDASALLLEALRDAALPAHVLDFGCGNGMLACLLASRAHESAFTLLDVDALALHAAAQNLPGSRCVISDGWQGLDSDRRFDLVVSNPPIHRGRDEDFSVLASLVSEAPRRLRPRARLVLVAQRTVGVGKLLHAHFASSRVLAESSRFQVWEGRA